MKIYKFLFYITYSALIVSVFFNFELTDDISPIINTFFVAGGVLIIPLILWAFDLISIESEKGSVENDKATNKLEQTEA